MFNIVDFLPKYPNIHNFDDSDLDFLNPYNDSLETSIFLKKEFNDNKLGKDETFPTQKGELLNAQKTIARYISYKTPYDKILLLWEMGVGKTCASVGAIEQIRKDNGTFTGAIILAKNDQVLENYKTQLVENCTSGEYIPPNFDSLNDNVKIRRINKLVKEYYEFFTYYDMAKMIQNTQDDYITNSFSNKIIVIDEVHNIRFKEEDKTSAKESVYVYNEIYRLLHNIKNCKVILLSGTPIKDKINELPAILNLILPKEDNLPIKKKFIDQYFDYNIEKDPLERIYKIKKSKKNELQKLLEGKISYVKAITTDVKKTFIGNEHIGELEYFTVYENFMDTFQSEIYFESFKKDMTELSKDPIKNLDKLYSQSKQSSLFVFPDGTYGNTGFTNEKWIKKNAHINFAGKKNKYGEFPKYYTYKFTNELKNLIKSDDDDEYYTKSLENLKKYSSKYASAIENILKAYKNKKSSFVYSNLVTGSGNILFSMILELFGFSKANGNELNKGLRYALLESSASSDIKKLKDRFNKPDNMYGEYINVLIGSKIVSEAYSFLNVQEEHILTPHWNYAETDQAIARGYRYRSHLDLINAEIIKLAENNNIHIDNFKDQNGKINFKLLENEINKVLLKPIGTPLDIKKPELYVYQYVSIPTKIKNDKIIKKYEDSVDLLMYKRSEIKDINIKHIERILKEVAFDCSLSYNRNLIKGYDYKRECDYMSCEYNCINIPSKYYKDDTDLDSETEIENNTESDGGNNYQLDYSTYQLYYNRDAINKIIENINMLFKDHFQISLNEFKTKYFKDYRLFEIITALRELINNNTIIHDKYNLPRYLREENNIYFLVDNIYVEGNFLAEYYTKNPILNSDYSFEKILNDEYNKHIPNVIKTLYDIKDKNEFKKYILKLPVNIIELIIQNSIIAKIKNVKKNITQRDFVLDIYKEYYKDFSIENVPLWILWFQYSINYNDSKYLKCLKNIDDGWKTCNEYDLATFNKYNEELKNIIINENPYGFYGKIGIELDKDNKQPFCISDVDINETGDARFAKTGIVCGTGKYQKPGLINLICFKLKIPIPEKGFNQTTINKINSKNQDVLLDEIKNNTQIKNLILNEDITIEDLNNLNKEKIDTIYYWIEQTVKNICSEIKIFFEKNDLLFTDSNCGTQKKKKSKK